MKGITACTTRSLEPGPKKREPPKEPRRGLRSRGECYENEADGCRCRSRPAAGSSASEVSSRLLGGIRREEADEAAGNPHQMGIDQSPFVVPHRREESRWHG